MAGSLNHIVNPKDGTFRMGGIENLGDAHEALDECFKLIYKLSHGDIDIVNASLRGIGPPIEHPMKLVGNDAL